MATQPAITDFPDARADRCIGWRINYRREKGGRVTRCQDGERIYASKADAEQDAAWRRRTPDLELDRLYGREIVEVREVHTSLTSIKRGAIHPAFNRDFGGRA